MRKPRQKDLSGIGRVHFVPSPRAKYIRISLRSGNAVRVAVPRSASFSQALAFVLHKQDWIRKNQARLRHWEKNHLKSSQSIIPLSNGAARSLLIQRVAELARLHGFSYNRVFIRRQRTRWGSCSTKNNISLNIRLAGLPDMLRDYVILHELLHTRIKGHGQVFWEELSKYVGDARGIRKRLNQIPLP